MLKKILIISLLLVSSVSYCETIGGNVGEKAYDFSLQDLKKKEFQLESVKDKHVLLVFFATWCPPCTKEVPILKELQEKYSDELEIVAINITFSDKEKKVRKFVKKHKLKYKILLDKTGEVSSKYGVRAVPTNIFIDKDGVIQHRNYYIPENIGEMLK